MALYSMISYRDPKVGAYTVPEFIPGASEEAIKDFVENIQRQITLGKVAKANDGFECFRVGVFDDNTGRVHLPEAPEHLIDLICRNEGDA